MRLSLVPRLHVDFTLLSPALEAHLEELLDALIRLSSHGSLVSLDLVARDEDTVHGDDHAILEMEDVTAVEVVSVDFHFGGNSIVATTGDIDLNLKREVLEIKFIWPKLVTPQIVLEL